MFVAVIEKKMDKYFYLKKGYFIQQLNEFIEWL